MQRRSGWRVGGRLTTALWGPGISAAAPQRIHQDFRHDWRAVRQDQRTRHRTRWQARHA